MSVDVAPMPHSWLLADDFLSLEHWYPTPSHGGRGYEVRPESSVGAGNAMWVGDSGSMLHIARDTLIPAGSPVVMSWWAYRDGQSGPADIQLRQYMPDGGLGNRINVLPGSSSQLAQGWNRCVAHTNTPEDWAGVRISLSTPSSMAGGMIARLRAMPAGEGEQS